MISLRVIHIKSTIKYIGIFILTVVIIAVLTNIFFRNDIIEIEDEIEKGETEEIKRFDRYTFLSSLKIGLPAADIANLDENVVERKTEVVTTRSSDMLKRFMNTELAMLDNLEVKDESQIGDDNKNEREEEGSEEKQQVELASKEVTVEKVSDRNIDATYTVEQDGVKIKNQSSYKLTSEMLKDDYLPENLNNILIFHTHTCESYTESEKYQYEATGNYRTTDLKYSVARVGDELTSQLEEYGFNVVHDKTYHDYPAYNGSYDRSLKTVENILKDNKDTDIVIDLHRDAVGNGKDYGPTVKINGESVAQIMLVIGSDGGGLTHPNWQRNLKIAMKIQKKAEELYPGLFRPMIVRDSRYNQQVRDGAMIIEVGATANTLDESLASMKYLALILNETFLP